jgi:hypothetical protein
MIGSAIITQANPFMWNNGRWIQLPTDVQKVRLFLQVFLVFDISDLMDSGFGCFYTLFSHLVVTWLYGFSHFLHSQKHQTESKKEILFFCATDLLF